MFCGAGMNDAGLELFHSNKGTIMSSYPLSLRDGHLFVSVHGQDWLLDTGGTASFGAVSSILIDVRQFGVPTAFQGMNAIALTALIHHPTVGLIGADILKNFDFILDLPSGQATFAESLELPGMPIPMDEFMGIPIIQANLDGRALRMFFDTGAQISYLQNDALVRFPAMGAVTDFYPGMGEFQTETYRVELALADELLQVRCGSLPGLLGMALMMAGTEGILGNEVIRYRRVGFFPSRGCVVFA